MGNRRFRLSGMMPNAWFYRLRDMSNQSRRRKTDPSRVVHTRKHSSPTSVPCDHRQDSLYSNTRLPRNTKALDIHLSPNPPRKSPKRSFADRKSICRPSLSPRSRLPLNYNRASCPYACNSTTKLSSIWLDCHPAIDQDVLYYSASPHSDHPSSPQHSLPSHDPFDEVGSWSSSCSPRFSYSTADIIIDIDDKSSSFAIKKLEKFDNHMALPPILTKPSTKKRDVLHQEVRKALPEHHCSPPIEALKQKTNNRRRRQQGTHKEKPKTNRSNSPFLEEPSRKSPYSKPVSGVKVRGKNSPRVLAMSFRKMQVFRGSRARRTRRRRSSLSESFAVIKCSYDPEKDFRDSMMEMIVEHHIQASKDLEDLLACYLTLNLKEYHDLIVEAFEQIWCDMFLGSCLRS